MEYTPSLLDLVEETTLMMVEGTELAIVPLEIEEGTIIVKQNIKSQRIKALRCMRLLK